MTSAEDELADLADLADLVLNVAKLIRSRSPSGPGVIELKETERLVMRLVDLHPGITPSELAQRARLQRTNVSTALRGLEAKGMVARTSAGGRAVTVNPTQLAVDNLAVLRAAWAAELAPTLRGDLDAVRRCNDLLARLERQLNQPGA